MGDSDPILLKHEVEQDVFGTNGFKIGPVMASTNPKILFELGRVLAAIGIFGYGIWLALSSPTFTAPVQCIIGTLAFIGVWTVHVVLVEIYSSGAKSGWRHSEQSHPTNEGIENR